MKRTIIDLTEADTPSPKRHQPEPTELIPYPIRAYREMLSWFNSPICTIGSIQPLFIEEANIRGEDNGFHLNRFRNKDPKYTWKATNPAMDIVFGWILQHFSMGLPIIDLQHNLEAFTPRPFRLFQTIIWLINPTELDRWFKDCKHLVFNGNEFVTFKRKMHARNLSVSPYFFKIKF